MAVKQTEKINWDFLLAKIEEEACVLVLGPELLAPGEGRSLQQALVDYLDVANNDMILRYYPDDQFFLFRESYHRTLVCHVIKKFFQEELAATDTLRKIAEIPFHIYLDVAPDKVLNKIFHDLELSCQYGLYRKNKDPHAIETPTRKLPLIYNVFGSIDSDESLILTHDDLYDYFKSIFARKSMPQELKDKLQDAKNFIFLGVPFEKWYMQLLLRELEIHKPHDFLRFAANQSLSEDVETLCIEQFHIQFIQEQYRIPEFIDELHRRCAERGLLREKSQSFDAGLDDVRRLVQQAEIERAIERFETLAEGTNLEEEVEKIALRFARFQKRDLKGMHTSDERSKAEAELSDALMQLIGQARKSIAT